VTRLNAVQLENLRHESKLVESSERASAIRAFMRSRLSSPALVGREDELGSLVGAAIDPPALIVVAGEAGVGKTRLVGELLDAPELGACHSYLGGCQPLVEPFPLGPVLDALRNAVPGKTSLSPVAGVLRPHLPELAPFLPDALEPLADRAGERHRLFRALRELLAALGRSVLVLEDLHWADELTSEFLRFLCPNLPSELTLVCTYRREDVCAASVPEPLAARVHSQTIRLELELRPLAKDEVRALAEAILEAEAISEEFAEFLFQGSGGLPFAVEEVLRSLENKDLTRRKGPWVRYSLEDLAIPGTVRDSVLERLGRLAPSAQALVRAAAVLGVQADQDLLAEVADLRDGRAESALAEALSAALLVEASDNRFCLRHELARRAVEEALPSPLRRQLHLRAARELEKGRRKPLARLAHHYRAAGEPEEWTQYAEATADQAQSLDDALTAYRFLREALGVETLPPARRAGLAIKFLIGFEGFGQKDTADVVRPLLCEGSIRPELRGELCLHLGRFLCQAGESDEGYGLIREAIELLRSRPALSATAMAFLAEPSVHAGRLDEYLSRVDRAAGEAARSGDRALQIRLSADRACTLLTLGDTRAWEAMDKIPPPGGDVDEVRQAARASGSLAGALLHLGYQDRAQELIEKNLADGRGWLREHLIARVTSAQLDFVGGDWRGLDERIRTLLEEGEDRLPHHADLEAVLGLLRLARGEVGAAAETFERLSDEKLCDTAIVPWVGAGLARIRLAEGNPKAALAVAARAVDIVVERGVWAWATDVAPVTVEALLGARRPAAAAKFVRRLSDGLEGRDAPSAAAALRVCRGLLAEASGDVKGATREFADAERRWRALPRPYEAARARGYRGRSLLAKDPARGRRRLVEAMDDYRALGAQWDAGRIRAVLRRRGLVPPHRAGRRGYGSELSPREHEVVHLASEGFSNREIALSLTVSRSTVEHHMTSAMRKVGATSRHELGELSRRRRGAFQHE
jgi:DNA-binding CsgD family transcriptional regulator